MTNTSQKTIIEKKLAKLVEAFTPILYEDDEIFLEGMKDRNLAGDDIRRYQHWEWTQGVGLYGLWKRFAQTGEQKYMDILTRFFDAQMEIGFPALNVNTAAPFLTMSYVGEHLQAEKYLVPCREAAAWIMEKFPRTKEGGFQHMTSDTLNDQELWDDTLFMTVLFLANMGRIEGKREYIQEAQKQFLLHAKYLADPATGLWYHGWTFNGNHNFAAAFWGRGNCWVTIAIPEFLQMVEVDAPVRDQLTQILLAQVRALANYQDESGMWHTLIDDPTSYVESSATCGFGYGILKAVHTGLIDPSWEAVAFKALDPMLNHIGDDGVVNQVSYGTPMGRESKDFYKNIELRQMPYGQALAMLFLAECLHH
jgi:unsaturated rhamnogalacturonyl hydrolase